MPRAHCAAAAWAFILASSSCTSTPAACATGNPARTAPQGLGSVALVLLVRRLHRGHGGCTLVLALAAQARLLALHEPDDVLLVAPDPHCGHHPDGAGYGAFRI